jgi:hypothetical protein
MIEKFSLRLERATDELVLGVGTSWGLRPTLITGLKKAETFNPPGLVYHAPSQLLRL